MGCFDICCAVPGELFDHGVDSLSTVFMPVAIFSAFGRAHEYGGFAIDMHIITWCVFFTFATSHFEKYNTQVATQLDWFNQDRSVVR